MQRKPGGYRRPTQEQRRLSMIGKADYNEWFRQFWNITGASTKNHPAPFPFELAYRLVRMFSFWGDTVLDPFCGTGTTMLAALKCGRNSIGVEIDAEYCRMALHRLRTEGRDLLREAEIEFSTMGDNGGNLLVQEESAVYGRKERKRKSKRTRAKC
jgi:site-specific DNA-methyltransferase (adenine-specific)